MISNTTNTNDDPENDFNKNMENSTDSRTSRTPTATGRTKTNNARPKRVASSTGKIKLRKSLILFLGLLYQTKVFLFRIILS